jgi:hypothetical protein
MKKVTTLIKIISQQLFQNSECLTMQKGVKETMMRNKLATALLFGLTAVFMSGCGAYKISSSWKDRDIKIDGDDSEWNGRMTQCDSTFFGVCNDTDSLYMCITTTDDNVKSQLLGMYGQTFTLWFDPDDDNNKTFGLRFSSGKPYSKTRAGSDSTLSDKNQIFMTAAKEYKENLKVAVIENGKIIAQLADTKGIETALGVAQDGKKLTYELKVPLKTNDSTIYAIKTSPGKTIGVIFESSKTTASYANSGSRHGGGPGASSSGGGSHHKPKNDQGSSGSSSGQGGGSELEAVDPVSLYIHILLSANK